MPLSADVQERTVRGVRRWCHSAALSQDLLRGVADRVRPIVPYDTAAWLVTDPATVLFTGGLIEGFEEQVCEPWFHNEFWVDDVNKFVHLTRTRRAAVLSRTTDPARSPRWAEVMRPVGLDAEVRVTFDDATGCWGAAELHRAAGEPDFADDEAALLARIAPVVADGLRRVVLERSALADERTDGPGLIVVRCDGTLSAATAAGEAWLALLVPADHAQQPSPALRTLAALVQDQRGHRLRLRALDGRWVTLHASRLTGDEGVAVIVEPSRPSDLAALIAQAYGLTPREQQVVLALARGASTVQLAEALVLSPHTVREHVKTAMGKVGVSSRAELVASLFERHTGFAKHAG